MRERLLAAVAAITLFAGPALADKVGFSGPSAQERECNGLASRLQNEMLNALDIAYEQQHVKDREQLVKATIDGGDVPAAWQKFQARCANTIKNMPVNELRAEMARLMVSDKLGR